MKYTEFEAKIKELNGKVTYEFGCVLVRGEKGLSVAKVSLKCVGVVKTDYVPFFEYEHKHELLDLVVALAKTPLEEREEEKKYRYFLSHLPKRISYLNYETELEQIYYRTDDNSHLYKTIFTEKEYEELAERKGIKDGIHEKEEVKA